MPNIEVLLVGNKKSSTMQIKKIKKSRNILGKRNLLSENRKLNKVDLRKSHKNNHENVHIKYKRQIQTTLKKPYPTKRSR